jgi:phosphoglycolate phosphatase
MCIFDLDGTLIDSRRGIVWAARLAAERAAPAAHLTGLDEAIGARALELFTACLPDQTPEVVAAVIAEFRRAYDNEGWRMADLYDGVPEVMSQLEERGIRRYIVTNKPALPTRQILDATGLSRWVDEAVSPDTPNGGLEKRFALRSLVERLAVDRSEVVYVGDTVEDGAAAAFAGVRFVGVSYGYGASLLRSMSGPLIAAAKDLPAAITGSIDPEVNAKSAG